MILDLRFWIFDFETLRFLFSQMFADLFADVRRKALRLGVKQKDGCPMTDARFGCSFAFSASLREKIFLAKAQSSPRKKNYRITYNA